MVLNYLDGRGLNAVLHEVRPSLYRPVKVVVLMSKIQVSNYMLYG